MSLKEQKLIKSNLFIFSFGVCNFGVMSKELIPKVIRIYAYVFFQEFNPFLLVMTLVMINAFQARQEKEGSIPDKNESVHFIIF